MTFTELRFLALFLAVFLVHWSLPWHRARKLLLLVASYVFYGAWDYRFLGLILLSTVVDYAVGLGLAKQEKVSSRRRLLVVSLVLNLGLLAVFKYFNFFTTSAAELLASLGLHTTPLLLDLILPVGISFYTFQTLSYTIDVYRRRLEPTRDFWDFALFVGFFPQLVAGPIVRASEFLGQLSAKRSLAQVSFQAALTQFLFGFVKKACIADNVAVAVDQIFAAPGDYPAGVLWLGALLYFIQIYCDFSGYSDMAIATAAMLGYRLPINFSFPIFSRSITEFWRRWHISLSTWFRDYLYIPLGGSRSGPARTYLNLWLVFFLCALWHGAAWTFVVWGSLHGLLLVIERATGMSRRLEGAGLGLLGWGWTFFFATVAWVFFRSASLDQAAQFLTGMAGLGSGSAALPHVARWAFVAALFLTFHGWNRWVRIDHRLENLPRPVFAVFIGVAFSIALPFASNDYQPFIYFQF